MMINLIVAWLDLKLKTQQLLVGLNDCQAY